MASSIPALVEPAVLRWARETIGLTPVAAARKIGVPEGRVADWESGAAQPTVAQLRKAANVYNRALSVFFLAEPPLDFDTLRDFRRHAGATAGEWSPELHAEYRRAHEQRENALELLELEDEQPSTRWKLEVSADDSALAAAARDHLLESSPLELPGRSGTQYDHLNTWVAALETTGVLVLATRGGRVSTQEMRAFSLFFDELPVVMVNGSDSPRGRLFSLMHEYAHLLLHTGGLCDMVSDARATTPNRQLEARCNAIAAAILMPAQDVLNQPEVTARVNKQHLWDYPALKEAAARFGVSAEAYLRRLVTLGRVSLSFYQQKRPEFLQAYEEEESRRKKPGSGSFYRTTVRDLGKGYVRQVTDAHRRRVIDSYTAATYLNVKVGQLKKLAATASLRESV